MEYRKLGRSGMYVSEIAYGNWLTHGSQIDDDLARQCVHAALDAGISTFDTADAYAETRAEAALGSALAGIRRESVEIFTKVYFPTGPGKNDRGLSRKHIMEAIDGSLHRLKTDYVDLYQAHRFDYETPLEETMQAFADVVVPAKPTTSASPNGRWMRSGQQLPWQMNSTLGWSPTNPSTTCCGGLLNRKSSRPAKSSG